MADSRRVRIAVALVALRYKPAAQSCASYILHLQESFPLPTCQRTQLSKNISGPPESWRKRVVELEAELREMQEKLYAEQTESAVLRSRPPSDSAGGPMSSPPCPTTTPIHGKKKKSKKVAPPPTSVSPRAKVSGLRLKEILHEKSDILELKTSTKLLSSFEALAALIEARTHDPLAVSIDAFCSAVENSLSHLATTLTSILPPSGPTAATSRILETLSLLTVRYLTYVVPLLTHKVSKRDAERCDRTLDSLMGQLTTHVLVPLTKSFSALSTSHLSALLHNSKKGQPKKPLFDIRPDILGFLRMILERLQNECPSDTNNSFFVTSARSVHEALTLCAIRELDTLFSPNAPPDIDDSCDLSPAAIVGTAASSPQCSPLQRQFDERTPTSSSPASRAPPPMPDRLQKLARKDALWYLCALLHHTLSGATICEAARPASSSDAGPNSDVLRAGVCTVLAGLLRRTMRLTDFHVQDHDGREQGCEYCPARQDARWLLGEVEREMLLAVAEKLWFS